MSQNQKRVSSQPPIWPNRRQGTGREGLQLAQGVGVQVPCCQFLRLDDFKVVCNLGRLPEHDRCRAVFFFRQFNRSRDCLPF